MLPYIRAALIALLLPLPALATEPSMTLLRLTEIVQALDPDVATDGRSFQMTIDDIPVVIITDAGGGAYPLL
jgi:hypothetical protein